MMRQESPLRKCHDRYAESLTPPGESLHDAIDRPGAARGQRTVPLGVEYVPYGASVGADGPGVTIVGTYGEVESEYAAIRRGAALFDAPHRATLIVTGADRLDYLNQLTTQDLKALATGRSAQAFLLNRKGRIEADVRVAEFGELTLVDVDVHQAETLLAQLEASVFTEDVRVRDSEGLWHRIEIHGPDALALLGAATDTGALDLSDGQCVSLALDGDAEIFVVRHDTTGVVGLHLLMPRDRAEAVWTTLLELDATVGKGKRRVRPIGWFAFNIARIEAGTPLMNVDFGPMNLPHETGVLRERVSFTTGCYPGQEVVARMENLGRPKQTLTGLRIDDAVLPIAGDPVYHPNGDDVSEVIGTITSSCLSPMLGAAPIAFAMLRTEDESDAGDLAVKVDDVTTVARRHSRRFLPDATGPSTTEN